MLVPWRVVFVGGKFPDASIPSSWGENFADFAGWRLRGFKNGTLREQLT